VSEPRPQRSEGSPLLWNLLLVIVLATAGGLVLWRTVRGLRAAQLHEKLERSEAPAAYGDLDGPGFGSVASFDLVDQDGKPFARAALDGKVWIADFIFTYCAGPCPAMSAEIEKIRADFPGEPSLHFVSFTVDPKRDTAPALAAYAQHYGGAGDRWHFLTGDPKGIYAAARQSFHAAAEGGEELGDPTAISHSERFFLVDREGIVRGRYPIGDRDALAALRRDAAALLRRGGAR